MARRLITGQVRPPGTEMGSGAGQIGGRGPLTRHRAPECKSASLVPILVEANRQCAVMRVSKGERDV